MSKANENGNGNGNHGCKEIVRAKIFLGTVNCKADQFFNEWMEENPGIEILQFRYEQARYGDHSIAVLYKMKK